MSILVIAEHDHGSIKSATLNTVTAAAQIGGDVARAQRDRAEARFREAAQRLAELVGRHHVAVDMGVDAPLGVDHADADDVVEARRRGEVAEAEVARQRVHRGRRRTEEIPVRLGDAVLRGEGAHRLRRIGGLVEADAHHVEGVVAEGLAQRLQRALQRARAGRADLEAAGIDEAHQQRLAAVARERHRAAVAVLAEVRWLLVVVFDVTASYPWEVFGYKLSSSFGIYNVTDKDYNEGGSGSPVLAPKRNWLFTNTLKF